MKKVVVIILASLLTIVLVLSVYAYEVRGQKDLGTGWIQIRIACKDSNNRNIYLNKKYNAYCLSDSLDSSDCDYSSMDKIAKRKCNE